MSRRRALLAVAGLLLLAGGFASGLGIASVWGTQSPTPTATPGPRFTAYKVGELVQKALESHCDRHREECLQGFLNSPFLAEGTPIPFSEQWRICAFSTNVAFGLGPSPTIEYRGRGQWYVKPGGVYTNSVTTTQGGFRTLTQTVAGGPWIFDEDTGKVLGLPTPAPASNFTQAEVLRLTQAQVSNLPFPGNTRWIRCSSASFKPEAGRWVVMCGYSVNKDDKEPKMTMTYLFDEKTGKVVQ